MHVERRIRVVASFLDPALAGMSLCAGASSNYAKTTSPGPAGDVTDRAARQRGRSPDDLPSHGRRDGQQANAR